MSLNANNWSSHVHLEIQKIFNDEIDSIVNQVDKLDDENMSLEFQVLSLEKENEHLKSIYQNLFDSIKQTRAQTKLETDSLQEKLKDKISKNVKLRAQLKSKFSEQKDELEGTSANTKFQNLQPWEQNFILVDEYEPNKHIRASVRTKPITSSQPHVIKKKDVNSNTSGLSSTGVESSTRSKDHNLGAIQILIRPHLRLRVVASRIMKLKNDKSRAVCATCKICLISANHDEFMFSYVNGMNSRNIKQSANVSNIANQKKHKANVKKSKKLGSKESLASSRPHKPRICLRLSIFINSGCSKHMTGNLKLLINFLWKFMGTLCFGNDHVAVILDLEVAFRRNTCFVRNLDGVRLLKGNCSTNLYTINLYEMTSASPICLMARATSTKSWLCDEVFLALGWYLEEIHMTWAHLEKKWTRLQIYTISLEESCSQSVETASQV
ncbi:hypothetical protein Tco_0470723 [Tanacetum coccineum]